MTIPFTLQEQKKLSRFATDESIAFYFSAGILDKVWKINKDGKAEQATNDIPQATEDIRNFREAMKKYGIVNSGPMNPESQRCMYELKDPSWTQLKEARSHLRKRFIN